MTGITLHPSTRHAPSKRRGMRVLRLLFLCSLGVLVGPAAAVAQDEPPCDTALAEAESEFFAARFDEAIQILDRCLARNAFEADEREEAYSLLGRVYFAKGLEDKAAEMVQELLALVPNYRPNPAQETPDFVAFVERVREDFEAAAEPQDEAPPAEAADERPPDTAEDPADDMADLEEPIVQPAPPESTPTAEERPDRGRRGLTKWLLIGGGAVVTGVVAALLLSGDPMPPAGTTLPPPPAHPSR